MMFSLASLCNLDAFKRENLNTSLQLCPGDSKASYYKIIVYSFLSTVITFAGLVSRFITKVSVILSYIRDMF